MEIKEWGIEQTSVPGDYIVYSITYKSFLGVNYKCKDYVMTTKSDGQTDFDWIKVFNYNQAEEFVREMNSK